MNDPQLTKEPDIAMSRRELTLILCMALILIGGLVGGGPTTPMLSMFVELIGCSLIMVACIGLFNGECPKSTYPAVIWLLLVCLVPVIQLIPLPPDTWHRLPGHQIPATISTLVGLKDISRPLTLDPEQTRLRGLALIPPAAAFIATLQLRARERDAVMVMFVAFAFANAVLGLFQVTTGGLYLYSYSHFGFPVGFFANRNHVADALLLAIPLTTRATVYFDLSAQARRLAIGAATVFFSIAVVATQSRTGIILLPIAILGTLMVSARSLASRRLWIAVTTASVVVAVVAAILVYSPVGQEAFRRFAGSHEDVRSQFWSGTQVAISQYWPAGSGLGSFVPVYDMVEDLDSVAPTWLNHAHNDYLEIILETGLAGCVLMVGYAILGGLRLFAGMPHHYAQQRRVAVLCIALLLLHALTDYSLRTFGLLAMFAFFHGLLFAPKEPRGVWRKGSYPASPSPSFSRTPELAGTGDDPPPRDGPSRRSGSKR